MTIATAKRFKLEVCEWEDIFSILHQTYSLWGAGLDKSQYAQLAWWQSQQPWVRRNWRYLCAKDGNEILCSLKLNTLTMQARGKQYKVGGIGAVFTNPAMRGRGHGSDLMDAVVELAEQEHFDGLMLFSDIDPGFYARSGFVRLGDNEFFIFCNRPDVERQLMSGPGFVQDFQGYEPDVALLSEADVSELARHHRRYLATIPFGIVRDADYFKYKMQRELWIQEKSSYNRPPLEVISLDYGCGQGGYAIFEQAGEILRVLEVVGLPDTREVLWRHVLRTAILRGVILVRGWESIAPTFVRAMRYIDREWAHPMVLPLNDELIGWQYASPCPLMELDHF